MTMLPSHKVSKHHSHHLLSSSPPFYNQHQPPDSANNLIMSHPCLSSSSNSSSSTEPEPEPGVNETTGPSSSWWCSKPTSWLQLGLSPTQQGVTLDLNLGGPTPPPPPVCASSPTTTSCFPPFYYQFSHQHHPTPGWSMFDLHNNVNREMSSRSRSNVYSSATPALMPSDTHTQIKPPRPQPQPHSHSGLWFMLLPCLPQSTQPFLPPLSKSFLRIKDGRVKVGLVIKYVCTKLGLETESQVEIRCKGEVIEPILTLQHVRDEIWSRNQGGDALTLLPNSSTSQHLMLLHYGRTSPSSTLS